MVMKSTQNIRALTTKIVQVAQDQKLPGRPAQAPPAAAPGASGGQRKSGGGGGGGSAGVPAPGGKAGATVAPKAAPSAEPIKGNGGGVEESKVNGPPQPRATPTVPAGEGGGGGSNGGGKSSTKKKGRR